MGGVEQCELCISYIIKRQTNRKFTKENNSQTKLNHSI